MEAVNGEGGGTGEDGGLSDPAGSLAAAVAAGTGLAFSTKVSSHPALPSARRPSSNGQSPSAARRNAALRVVGLSSVHRRSVAATESFMMTTKDFLANGSSPTTSNCGLKLYNDLTRGTYEACETYGNDKLVGAAIPDFAVTFVEVYAVE
ncbi:unnamed protein product [Pylaiella littoralis]